MAEKLSDEKFTVVGTEEAQSCFADTAVDSKLSMTTWKRDLIAVIAGPVKILAYCSVLIN